MAHDIFCIFLKEFNSYFRTRLAYFIMAIYVVLSMVTTFYTGYYFQLVNDNLYSFFYFQPEIYTLLIPALTMKLWADERRYGTLELLLSQPASHTSMVLGKFFAAWAFCVLMISLSLPLWASTAQITSLDNLNIIYSYAACLLTAGALCAVGCVVSSFNSNPISAYLLSLGACMLLKLSNFDYFIKKAQVSNELLIRMSQSLNFDRHFINIISGQISWSDGIYYLSVIVFALWLNVASIEYKRS